MYPDGICRVTDTRYTRTIQFQDINYQLAQNEDKQALFDGWCDFLITSTRRFTSSSASSIGRQTRKSLNSSIDIPSQNDDFDSIRAEYANMLRSQLAQGQQRLAETKIPDLRD